MSETTTDELHSEIQSLHDTLDVRWASERRAIEMWQERTGKTLTRPDHADLCVWLMEENERLREEAAREIEVFNNLIAAAAYAREKLQKQAAEMRSALEKGPNLHTCEAKTRDV